MMILRRERVSSESLLGCIDDDTLWKVKAVKCGFRVFECRTFDCCVHFLASKMGNGASAPKNKVGKRVVREVSLHISIPSLISASGVCDFVRS